MAAARLVLNTAEVRLLWQWGLKIREETTWFDSEEHQDVHARLQEYLLSTGDLKPIGFQLTK